MINLWDLTTWLVDLLVSQPTILPRILAASSWKKGSNNSIEFGGFLVHLDKNMR